MPGKSGPNLPVTTPAGQFRGDTAELLPLVSNHWSSWSSMQERDISIMSLMCLLLQSLSNGLGRLVLCLLQLW